MKRTIQMIALAGALGITAFGQTQKTQPVQGSYEPQPGESTSKKAKRGDQGKNDPAPTASPLILEAGTTLEAQLQSAIDVRKSQVGDEVVLKTTKTVKHAGDVVIPKGTNLVGRITEVKEKTKEDTVSKLSMVIDRVQGKDLNMPVDLSIVSMAAAGVTASAGDLFSSDLSGSASGSASGRSSGGGGLLSAAGGTLGSVVNTATQTVGGTVGAASGIAGQSLGTVGRTMNGLQISNSLSGSAGSSSTVTAQGKNVRIEKGTTFNLRTGAPAAAPQE